MKARCIRSFLFAVAIMASFPLGASAADFLLTMDDLPVQPVHNLIHPTGVEFAFTVNGVPSQDARYAAGGPGITTFIRDPSIEGNSAGVLFVNFPESTPFLTFGVARSVANPTNVLVELFDSVDDSLGVRTWPLTPMPLYAEGQFVYRGRPVSRLTISFPPPNAGRFVVDNLFFRIVPEPASIALAAIGVAVVTVGRRRRRRHPLDCRRSE